MKKLYILTIAMAAVFALSSCGGGSSSGDPAPVVNDGESAAVTVTLEADYGAVGVGAARSIIPTVQTVCTDNTADDAGFVPGTDCDGDGGVVAYEGPSGFKVAIKRLALVKSDSTMVDLIPDRGLLSNSYLADLENPVQLNISEIEQGYYTAYYAEMYYYELTMDVDGAEKLVRIYLSDDDFPAEGSLGNHQGDVKMMNALGDFAFVQPGLAWSDANLVDVRTNAIHGVATPDPQTGHVRGLYGNDDLWNMQIFQQGADQDIFVANDIVSMTGFTVGEEGGSVTITFDLDDTWFFEDFNGNGLFEPCTGLEACSDNAEWTPVFPGINFTFN